MELELSKTGPEAKCHKTANGESLDMDTEVEQLEIKKWAPPRPHFKSGGERPSFV